MKHLKILDTYACNMHVYGTSRSTFATSRKKHLQHTSRTDEIFGTYVYTHYNMCNILIYFFIMDIQHLQHTSETYSCNILFSPLLLSYDATQSRETADSGKPVTEDDGVA